MHLLIFLFASILGLDPFLVHAVVFAVCFFPRRAMLPRRGPPLEACAGS